MSRIHDALKRAEEQRQARGTTSPRDTSAKTAEPELPPITSELGFGEPEGVSASEPTPDSDSQESRERLLQDCCRSNWQPSRDALFLSAAGRYVTGLEEFRRLRSRLFQLRAQKPLKTVLVSSALPGEGKSFVSANLAQALASQRGGRTLLIDGDLRKPHIHKILGAPEQPGLFDYLSGKATEQEIVHRSESDTLFFIPGGSVNSAAGEVAGNGLFKQLIGRLTPLFDWIVVDSSPVLPVSDPTRLAEVCDGVILVVRAGVTPHGEAERAKDEFRNRSVLGVVMNHVSEPIRQYHAYRDYEKSQVR